MVQEQLGEEAEVLGVVLVLPPVNLEEGDGVLAVDLVARRILVDALGQVSGDNRKWYVRAETELLPGETDPGLEELEAELADVDAVGAGQLLGVNVD